MYSRQTKWHFNFLYNQVQPRVGFFTSYVICLIYNICVMKKITKILLPVATLSATIFPLACLTSCAKEIDVDDWDNTNKRLVSDFFLVKPNSRFRFEIEYDEWFEHSQDEPTGKFKINPAAATTSEFKFKVNKITLNRNTLIADTDFKLEENNTVIALTSTWLDYIVSGSEAIVDVNIDTNTNNNVFFIAY